MAAVSKKQLTLWMISLVRSKSYMNLAVNHDGSGRENDENDEIITSELLRSMHQRPKQVSLGSLKLRISQS